MRCGVVAVGECADASVWSLSGEALLQCLDGVEAIERSAAAAKLHLIREIDARGIPAA